MARLFHISDVHFGREDRAALAWFAAAVKAERPDAVVCTGDLTMRARAREWAAAGQWLAGLGVPVTVEPGNHDLPYFTPVARAFRPYRRFRGLEASIERPLEVPGVLLVPLKTTARWQWRNLKHGRVSKRGLARALAMLRAKPVGTVALVACHHPLVKLGEHGDHRTQHGPEALAALAAAGADALLSGHVHDGFDLVAPGTTTRLIGAGTLSERTRTMPPSFNDIYIEAGAIEVVPRLMDAK